MVDAALENQVLSALKRSSYLPGRQLEFEADQGTIVLRGVVGTYYQKQMAQELIRTIEGVKQVDNQLQVQWS